MGATDLGQGIPVARACPGYLAMGNPINLNQMQASKSGDILKVEAIVAKRKVSLEFASIYYIKQVCFFKI